MSWNLQCNTRLRSREVLSRGAAIAHTPPVSRRRAALTLRPAACQDRNRQCLPLASNAARRHARPFPARTRLVFRDRMSAASRSRGRRGDDVPARPDIAPPALRARARHSYRAFPPSRGDECSCS